MTSPRSDSWQVVELGFEPRYVWLHGLGSQPFCYAIWLLYFLEHSWGNKEGTLTPAFYKSRRWNGLFPQSYLLPPTGQMGRWTPTGIESPIQGASLWTNPGIKPLQMKGQPVNELNRLL